MFSPDSIPSWGLPNGAAFVPLWIKPAAMAKAESSDECPKKAVGVGVVSTDDAADKIKSLSDVRAACKFRLTGESKCTSTCCCWLMLTSWPNSSCLFSGAPVLPPVSF